MKLSLTLLALLATSALCQTSEPTGEAIARAAEFFDAKCATCHAVPDLDFAVDRAWLAQVADTA